VLTVAVGVITWSVDWRAVPIPELLDRLLRAPGPSGAEEAVMAVVREAASGLGARVEPDVLGSTIAVLGDSGPLLALVAHADQIGLAVSHVGDDGLLAVHKLSNWDPRVAVAQRVRVSTASGELCGVVGVRTDERDKPGFEDLYVDVGARDGAEARELVEPGDPIVFDAPPVELHDGRVAAGAIDNRASLWVGLETLRHLAEEPAPCTIALVATVHEEVAGSTSAAPPLRTLAPDLALALDVTYATDVPEADVASTGEHRLGSGPAIFRGPVVHPRLVTLLREAAAAEGVLYTLETDWRSLTDADVFYAVGGGIPSGLVSVPIRRMHTAVETAQLSDLEDTVRLLVAFVRRLGSGLDLSR
jgi:putative aminopeptidase FrvX